MDATCNVQDSIHVFHLVHNMCPGFWVHINLYERLFLFYHLLEKIYFPFYGIEKGLGIQLTVASPSL